MPAGWIPMASVTKNKNNKPEKDKRSSLSLRLRVGEEGSLRSELVLVAWSQFFEQRSRIGCGAARRAICSDSGIRNSETKQKELSDRQRHSLFCSKTVQKYSGAAE
jgi:hypothetical protein